MKVIAHADDDALLVEATNGKIYLIKIYRNSRNPNEIEELLLGLQRDGRTTEEDKEIAAMVLDKHTEGRARWGQGNIDLTQIYKKLTPEQRALLYD
jgi:hypothetical protein